MGDKYCYRQADGSYNNIMVPQMGAANTPYARSVRPGTLTHGALPDPGVIFDTVMARKKATRHPNNVSSMLYYIASIIIHDIFRTSHHDFNVSETSSYLDLSPLYGSNQAEQDTIRTFVDGKVKPDCFSEKRILGFPPGVGAILIMFNRFHNYVVEQLVIINENGRFTKPADGDAEKMKKYDNDLFQTGRLITCGLYINIILLDYLRTIVNLNRSNTTWTLDPRVDMGKVFGADGTIRGVGNQVSAEFNLVYRWHSAISDRDDKWTQDLYKKLFPGRDPASVTIPELLGVLGKWEAMTPEDPLKRPFGDMERQADGTFKDEDLVKILVESIEDPANASGPNQVPTIMRAIEILGMQQARKWQVATLNEFRKFFGLKAHETFESISSDPQVAADLKNLYDHPDFVELYTGIVVEDAKTPMVPGVGITPTFTVSRAILSDAVTLVRGDRFYTIDYHPKALTNWGYSEVQYDLSVEQGCVFYKLFLRAFPKHFKPNSIYAHYPLTIPSENRVIMTNLGRVDDYDYSRPTAIPDRVNIVSYKGAKTMLEDPGNFRVMWTEGFEFLGGALAKEFMLAGDSAFHAQQRKTMAEILFRSNWHQEVKDYYDYISAKLITQHSYKLAKVNQMDAIRDFGNITHVHFAANVFSLPLKTEDHPRGIYAEHEMYMVLAAIFVRIFFDLDPAKSFPLWQVSRAVSQQLGKLIEANVHMVKATGMVAGVVDQHFQNKNPLKDYGVHMVRALLKTGKTVPEVTWGHIFPTAGAMVANQAQVVSSTSLCMLMVSLRNVSTFI
jgi:linoleate 10R-lipoxygenase